MILSDAAGILVLAVTLLDILTTTLHPSAKSVLSGHFQRMVWRLIERVSRPLRGSWRQRVLSWTLPLSVSGLLVVWLLLLMAGFSLLYAPVMHLRGAFATVLGPLSWIDAIYYSGVCLVTVGFGDIVPRWGWVRVASIAEGLCGLLVVGVAITYILSVFPFLPLSRILATTLNEETDGRVNALPMVQRYLAVTSSEALAQRCRELATQIIALTEAHSSHPVLYYAHPRRVEQSFLRVLVVTQHLVAVLRYGLAAADYPDLVQDPRVVGLEESLIGSLRRMGASLHLTVPQPTDPLQQSRVRELEDDYDAMVAGLRQASLHRTALPGRREKRRYVRFRLVTDPYIEAYGANSGYNGEEPWKDYPPLRGSTAPLPGEGDEDDEE